MCLRAHQETAMQHSAQLLRKGIIRTRKVVAFSNPQNKLNSARRIHLRNPFIDKAALTNARTPPLGVHSSNGHSKRLRHQGRKKAISSMPFIFQSFSPIMMAYQGLERWGCQAASLFLLDFLTVCLFYSPVVKQAVSFLSFFRDLYEPTVCLLIVTRKH